MLQTRLHEAPPSILILFRAALPQQQHRFITVNWVSRLTYPRFRFDALIRSKGEIGLTC